MGWQWSADPRDWYRDHLTGRCGCSDDAPYCRTGRVLWALSQLEENKYKKELHHSEGGRRV